MSEHACEPAICERGKAARFSVSNLALADPVGRVLVLMALPSILPIMALIALAIRLGSPGPVILSLRKTNAEGKEYREYRFRCVWSDARARQFRHDASGHESPQCERDLRVTPVGSFLLRCGLNTLPQLFNVLKGDAPLSLHRRD